MTETSPAGWKKHAAPFFPFWEIEPVASGSSQSDSRVGVVPPPFHDSASLPYSSYVSLVHDAVPPWSWPMIYPDGLKRGEPDEPPSVVPSS